MIKKMNNIVWTSRGPLTGVEPKSLAGAGESITDFEEGTSSPITEGTPGVDNIPTTSSPEDNTFIAGNRPDWRDGKLISHKAFPHSAEIELTNAQLDKIKNNKYGKLSSLFKNTVRLAEQQALVKNKPHLDYLADLAQQLKAQHKQEELQEMRKNIPTADKGMSPWLPGLIGLGSGLMQLHHYASEPISYNNTYYDNPYERKVVEGMAGLRQNIYPLLRGVYDAERRGQYALNTMGGLTGGQRAKNRIALALGTQRNAADVIAANQAANIGLKSNYYKTLGELGQQLRVARMNAAQHDYANYVAAHGAKTKGIEQGIANINQSFKDMFNNQFKWNTYNDTLALYKAQQMTEEQKLELERIELQSRAAARASANSTQNNLLPQLMMYYLKNNGLV